MEACGFFFFLVGGGLVGRGRVAEAAPPPYYLGVAFSDACILGRADGVDGCAFYSWSSRPLEGRPCA